MGRHSHSRCRVNALAPATFALLASVSANAAPVDDVRTLVEAGNAEVAYTRRATIDVDAEPRADLWCGIVAVDVGRAGIGVFALEHYMLRYPDDARARAYSYFYAGDSPRARAAFHAVSKKRPPQAVQAGIDRYLDALRVREAQYHPTLSPTAFFRRRVPAPPSVARAAPASRGSSAISRAFSPVPAAAALVSTTTSTRAAAA